MKNKPTKFLPRSRSDYLTKLKKLEEEKQQLIQQRKEEIFSIIDKIGCLSIDNELLAGSLELLKEIEIQSSQGKELSSEFKSFQSLILEKSPIFFRKKSRAGNSKAEHNSV